MYLDPFKLLMTGLTMAAVCTSCATAGSSIPSQSREAREWLTRRPDRSWGDQLDRSKVSFVDAASRADAAAMLAERQWARLTTEQAAGLLPPTFVAPSVGEPFLLRAVRSASGRGDAAVYKDKDGAVLTSAGELSAGWEVQVERWPLIAWLDREPAEVYSTFSIAR